MALMIAQQITTSDKVFFVLIVKSVTHYRARIDQGGHLIFEIETSLMYFLLWHIDLYCCRFLWLNVTASSINGETVALTFVADFMTSS